MEQIVPDAVERYLAGLNQLADPVLREIAREGKEQKLPLIDAEVGGLLRVLATAIAASRILEIGTAVGYSGIWLAGALPADGMLLTMEMNPERAQRARENFARSGLAARVSVIGGDAQRMLAKVSGPFDLIFQDGDKQLYTPLLDRLVELLRPGGLLITDNVLWSGDVIPGFNPSPTQNVADTAAADFRRLVGLDPDAPFELADRVDTPAGSVVIGGDAGNDVLKPPRASSTSDQVEKLAKGVDIIVHSAFHPVMGPEQGSGFPPLAFYRQSLASDLGAMAKRVGAKHLMLTHLGTSLGAVIHNRWKVPGGPLTQADYRKAVEASGFTGNTIVGTDLASVRLPAK